MMQINMQALIWLVLGIIVIAVLASARKRKGMMIHLEVPAGSNQNPYTWCPFVKDDWYYVNEHLVQFKDTKYDYANNRKYRFISQIGNEYTVDSMYPKNYIIYRCLGVV